MTTIPGLFAIGESNFSDQGANRLGSASLMQTSGDGYFIIPYTIANYLSDQIRVPRFDTQTKEFEEAEAEVRARIDRLMGVKGTKSATSFHKRLGKIMWEYCGMSRNEAGLKKALEELSALEAEFWKDLRILGTDQGINQDLEKAGRVADFFEIGRLMCLDALNRTESCGAHFREESQTETGEAKRNDAEFSYVSAWEYKGKELPELHKEPLTFEFVKLAERSYK
jgi:succinate dehydrogenase or fumarate reductase, flavoprotein subunit